MTKVHRRIAVGIVVAAAVIAIGAWWKRGDEAGAPANGSAAPRSRPVATTRAAGDTPAWAGQAGVGGRRIAGVVIGETGVPVAGATVRLASATTLAGLTAEGSATTDATGRFDFGGRSGAEYDVIAEAPKLTGAVEHVDMRDPLLMPDQLRLVLHACETSIHGTVRDNAGGIIAGARITRERTIAGGASADASGAFEFCVPAGGVRLLVSADGYATSAETVNVFGRTRRDFELGPGAIVSGRVVRADNKSAVAGAILEIRAADRSATLMATSDEEGRFLVEGIAPGRHSIVARADRLVSATPVSVIAEVGRVSDDVVCELVGAVRVSGKVVLHGSDTPVAGVDVSLKGRALSSIPTAITQSDGTFAIDHVLPGEYTALPVPFLRFDSKRKERFAKVKVESTDVTGIVLEVDPSGSISGRILSDGKPVDGATVRIENTNRTTRSDHDGTYTLRWVEAGDVVVYAESHRVGAFGRSQPTSIAKGEDRTGFDVELNLSGSIAGVVVDQMDKPVPGVFLAFSLLHGRDFGAATTADDGTFTARALSGGGDYVYEVRQRERSPIAFPPVDGKRFPPIAVANGQAHVTGLRVKIRVERLAISGRIVDAANKPVPDVVVRALPDAVGRYAFGEGFEGSSDQSGAFVIRDVMPGSYRLRASGARGDGHVDKVVAGQSNIVVRLVEPGGIDGTLEGFTSNLVVAMREGENAPPVRGDASGTTFTFRNLMPGDYRIMARTDTMSQYARVTVTPGQIAKLTVRAAEVGVIEGTVADEKTGAPLVGLYCVSGNEDDFAVTSKPTTSDQLGAFRLERAPVGTNRVMCGDAMAKVVVTVGQTTHVELRGSPTDIDAKLLRGDAGLTVENQLGDVIVESVKAGGPAARAGVLRGDVVIKVGDTEVPRYGGYMVRGLIARHPLDKPLALTLERANKQLTVMVTLEPQTGSE